MKDIVWLKEEIKVFQEGENMFTAEFNAGVQQALEYVQELIDQLDEPETLNEEWINEHSKSYTMENSVEISDLKNLLLPQPKKPVIPQFVANWIEVSKKHYSIGAVFHDAYDGKLAKVAIEEYIFENQDLFAQAWLDGYEVEKEKLYRIKFSDNQYASRLNNRKINSILTDEELATQYTEAEIKAIDERYWAFAQEVCHV